MRTQVIFDGVNLSDSFAITDVARPDPELEPDTRSVPGMDGIIMAGANLGSVTIEMTLTAVGRTKQERTEAMHALTAFLNKTDEPRPLSFTDEDGLYRMAVPVSGGSRKGFFRADSKRVVFLVPDPILYGKERTATVPSGGTAYIHVGGTYKTRPKITAQSAVRSSENLWGVRLDDGDYSYVAIPTSSASEVSIDSQSRAVTVSGSTSMITLSSDWLELEPGEHIISMTQGTGAASVSWVERWL